MFHRGEIKMTYTGSHARPSADLIMIMLSEMESCVTGFVGFFTGFGRNSSVLGSLASVLNP